VNSLFDFPPPAFAAKRKAAQGISGSARFPPG
jgi:hypothetical protein